MSITLAVCYSWDDIALWWHWIIIWSTMTIIKCCWKGKGHRPTNFTVDPTRLFIRQTRSIRSRRYSINLNVWLCDAGCAWGGGVPACHWIGRFYKIPRFVWEIGWKIISQCLLIRLATYIWKPTCDPLFLNYLYSYWLAQLLSWWTWIVYPSLC